MDRAFLTPLWLALERLWRARPGLLARWRRARAAAQAWSRHAWMVLDDGLQRTQPRVRARLEHGRWALTAATASARVLLLRPGRQQLARRLPTLPRLGSRLAREGSRLAHAGRWVRPTLSGHADGVVMCVVLGAGLLAGWLMALRLGLDLPVLSTDVSAQRAPARPLPAPSPVPPCRFDGGFAELRQHLGARMGDPIDCPHVDRSTGDVVQRTTTGSAVYRTGTGLLTFTAGSEHWALTPTGLVSWTGPQPDPAESTVRQPTSSPRAATSARGRVANTGGVGVVLRASPRLEDRTPRGLLEGEVVTILEQAGGDWVRVRGEHLQEGWIPARYLVPVSTPG